MGIFDYYLLTESFSNIGIEALQENLKRLNESMVEHSGTEDTFFYSNDFYEVQIEDHIKVCDCIFKLSDIHFCRVILPQMLNKLRNCQPINEYKDLCNVFSKMAAFWGECFNKKEKYNLRTLEDMRSFRFDKVMEVVDASSLESYKTILFKKIVFCKSACKNLRNVSRQEVLLIVERLLQLDSFNQKWLTGGFSINQLNATQGLNASFESSSTREEKKYMTMRKFQLPNGEIQCFEPHIKTGNFRIHFFPDERNHCIYVGYIGPHLPTSKY